MAYIDEVFVDMIKTIHEKGEWNTDKNVRAKWRDGKPAYAKEYFGYTAVFDEEHQPLLGIKETRYEKALAEIFWIQFMQSNKVQDLRDLGSQIWNEWEGEDGTIGKAYGYITGSNVRTVDGNKVTQLDYAIHKIRAKENHRELITTVWDIHNLDKMNLRPCVYEYQLYESSGKLNMRVDARSQDLALGFSFNVIQYWYVLKLLAKLLDLEVGKMVYNIGVLHYYDRHEDLLNLLDADTDLPEPKLDITLNNAKEVEAFINNKEVTLEDILQSCKVTNYEPKPFMKFPVAE